MSNRRLACLSAASVLALSLAWTGPAFSYTKSTAIVARDASGQHYAAQPATGLLMSLALKGYDLSSTEGLVAALTATLHPVTTERARMVPTIMAGIRRLGLDPAQEVAALITLQDALDQVGTGIIAARDLAKLSQELQSAATTPIRQLAQLDVDVDLQAPLFICADGTTAASADGCVLNQNNQERGSESYSG